MSSEPDGKQKEADASSGNDNPKPKVWNDDEVKKIIEERDKAKEKARKYDEEKRKAEEAKALEEGKYKELLAQREAELAEANKKASAFEEQQRIRRELLLSKITDEKMKTIAEDLSLAKLEVLVDSQEAKGSPDTGKGARKGADQPDNPFKPKPGESYSQYQRRIETEKKKGK